MADIELVVKIDEELFKGIKICVKDGILNYEPWVTIAKGKPLPKGHGDLKDASELAKEIKSYICDTSNLHYDVLEEAEAYNSAYHNCLDEIEDAPTLIEADKESEDAE